MESNMNNTIDYTLKIDDGTLEQYANPSTPVMGQASNTEYANNMGHTNYASSPMNNGTHIDHGSSMGSFSPAIHDINPENAPVPNFTSPMGNVSSPMHNNTPLNHASPMGSFSAPFVHATAPEYATAINHTSRMGYTSSPMQHSTRMNNTSATGYSSPFIPPPAMNHSSPVAQFSTMAHFSPMAHSSSLAYPTGIEYANPMNYTPPINHSSPTVHRNIMEFPAYMDPRPQIDYSSMGPNSRMVHQYPLDYPRAMQNTTPMDFTHMNRVAHMGYTNTMGHAPAMNAMNHTSPMDFSSPMDHTPPMAYTTSMTPTVDMGHAAPMGYAAAVGHTTPIGDMALAGSPGPGSDAGSNNDAGQTNVASPFDSAGEIHDAGRMSVAGPLGFAGLMDDAGAAAGFGVAAGTGPGLASVGDPMEDPDLMRDAGLVGGDGPTNVAAEATTAARRPARRPAPRPADDANTRACLVCGRRRGAASFRDVEFLSALADARVPEGFFPAGEWPGSVPAEGYPRCHPCRVKRALDAWGEYARAVKDRNQTAMRREVKRAAFAQKQKEDKARVKAYNAAGLGPDDYLGEGGRSEYDPITRVEISEEEREKRLNQGRCSFLGHLCNKKIQLPPYCPAHRAMWLVEENLERVHQQAQQYWHETQIADAAADAAAGVGLPVALRPAIPLPAAPQPVPRRDPGTLLANAIEAYNQPRLSFKEQKKAITKARQTQQDAETKEWKAKQEAFRESLKEPLVKPGMGLCFYRKWSCPVQPMPGKRMCELHLEEMAVEDCANRRERKEEGGGRRLRLLLRRKRG